MYKRQHYENTDNAYVQGNLVQITPQTTGTVEAIMADETDFVQAGHALIKLDPADARVAYQQAEADLAQAVRQVRTLFVNNGSLSAQVTLREAEAARASNDVARATEDLRRRQSLSGNGAVSQEELEHTRSQLEAARAASSWLRVCSSSSCDTAPLPLSDCRRRRSSVARATSLLARAASASRRVTCADSEPLFTNSVRTWRTACARSASACW